ncbi:hypothetical protein [Propylenella binzhouense]|uniref:Protoporphyrinogen IX oxidase n=1 Tax=Propylenella binzhouense TaxID=2555902 RepID=A0A964WVD4_9HYPH|nr:hypothetical protein [Propylenella binzhouense]MYZ49700.1 hypothetical protein [Propylenella binzhouense]
MYDLLLMAHLIIIAMVTGMAFSHLLMLRVSAGQSGERGLALALARRTMADFTTMAVIFVWITGVMLLWSQYGQTGRVVSAWFYAKVGFVGILTVAHVMQRMQAARMQGVVGEEDRARLELWVAVVWLAALVSICLAVVSFARI